MAEAHNSATARKGADRALLEACERYQQHNHTWEERLRVWNAEHPDSDLPDDEEKRLNDVAQALSDAVRDLPAKTLAGLKAKARVVVAPEYWSGDSPSTVLHALMLDLQREGAR